MAGIVYVLTAANLHQDHVRIRKGRKKWILTKLHVC